MKRMLLLSASLAGVLAVQAQQRTAFAITNAQKGGHGWNEVRLIDVSTGEVLRQVYTGEGDVSRLNARTQKAIQSESPAPPAAEPAIYQQGANRVMVRRRIVQTVQRELPFATQSAALAYDKKHGRLYYTPMGLNELRYIDLKAKQPTICYFEGEPFGVVKSTRDAAGQITRMVIGADGNGYALSNDGNHFIRFTTNKKAEITDLGALSDDPANANHSIHSTRAYGGDMVADTEGNFYLITASKSVFFINTADRIATYKGNISGLPQGYSTNGAVVESGTSLIVCSSGSTQGYYRVDLNSLQAEKLPGGEVYNASDLANEVLVSYKRKEEKPAEVPAVATLSEAPPGTVLTAPGRAAGLSVFPNPVTSGLVRLSLTDQPAGAYQVQVISEAGQVVATRRIVVANKVQQEEFRLPRAITPGTYVLRIIRDNNTLSGTVKLIVQ
jgi:hypothetical protein